MDDLELLHSLNHAQSMYRRLYHRILEEQNPTNKDLIGYGRLLHTLSKNGEMTQKELAERLEIRPQSLTTALARLERNHYIERVRSTADRRIQKVSLTAEGKELSDQLHHLRFLAAQQFFSCLNEQEKDTLLTLLTKIAGEKL